MLFKVRNWSEHNAFAPASAKGKVAAEAQSDAKEKSKLGALPEWRLADLQGVPD